MRRVHRMPALQDEGTPPADRLRNAHETFECAGTRGTCPVSLAGIAMGHVPHAREDNERNRKMKTLQRIVMALVIVSMLGIGTIGCNTFRGAGKDIQRGGEVVEDTAIDAQRK
jgi:entericidin B